MPEVIAAGVTYAASAIGVSLSATAVSVASWAIVTALSLGASYALQQLAQKKAKQSPQQITLKQAMPPRLLVYGRDMIGGAFVFRETFGTTLYQVIAHGQGPWDAIEGYWLDDTACGPSIAAGSPAPWLGHVRGATALGAMGQPAFAELIAASGGQWSAAHRLGGVAATLIVCASAGAKFNAKIFPNGVPALRVLARGQADIVDPRDGVARWTDNPALAIRDYLTRRVDVTVGGATRSVPVGLGISPARIDDASFAAFAAVCDQAIALGAGGVEARYRLSHTIDLSQTERRAALAALLRTCDAELYPTPDGKVAIRGGVWTAPTVAIDEADILSFDYAAGSDRMSGVNRLKITFKSPTTYQPSECDSWEDVSDQARRGVLQQDFDAQSVPSYTQARRLARIQMMRLNAAHRLVLTVSYGAALRLWGERNFALTLAELGLSSVPMAIEKITLSPDTMTSVIECASEEAAAYEWSTALEGASPVIAVSTPVAIIIPDAPAPTLTIEWAAVAFSTMVGTLRADVPAPASAVGVVALFQFRVVGSPDWRDMDQDGDFGGKITPLSDGAHYEVRAAYAMPNSNGAGATMGAWSSASSIAVIANATPPTSSGSALSASSPAALQASVIWTTPNDPSLAMTRVYASTTTVFDDAVLVGTSYAPPASTASLTVTFAASGARHIWVRAFNGSGVGAASPLGPVAVTV